MQVMLLSLIVHMYFKKVTNLLTQNVRLKSSLASCSQHLSGFLEGIGVRSEIGLKSEISCTPEANAEANPRSHSDIALHEDTARSEKEVDTLKGTKNIIIPANDISIMFH